MRENLIFHVAEDASLMNRSQLLYFHCTLAFSLSKDLLHWKPFDGFQTIAYLKRKSFLILNSMQSDYCLTVMLFINKYLVTVINTKLPNFLISYVCSIEFYLIIFLYLNNEL